MPAVDRRIQELSRDCLEEPYSGKDLYALLKDRKAPIKALLLNQSLFAGVGNWVADEALYHSGVAPQRLPFTMKPKEFDRLAEALYSVLKIATEAGADSSKYPVDWLFHVRWGGKRGETEHQGVVIRRDTVGGRTSAWAPSKQK